MLKRGSHRLSSVEHTDAQGELGPLNSTVQPPAKICRGSEPPGLTEWICESSRLPNPTVHRVKISKMPTRTFDIGTQRIAARCNTFADFY